LINKAEQMLSLASINMKGYKMKIDADVNRQFDFNTPQKLVNSTSLEFFMT